MSAYPMPTQPGVALPVVLAIMGAVACTVLVGTGVRLRRCYVVVEVDGSSMLPTLQASDRLLVRRTPPEALQVGQIIVLRLPLPGERDAKWLVKRVAAVPGDPVPTGVTVPVTGGGLVPPDRVVVLGDNAQMSYDSRHCGPVHRGQILGVALRRLHRRRRRR